MTDEDNQIHPEATGRELRPYALARGEFGAPSDFDDPLPEAILKEFEGVFDPNSGDARQALKGPGYEMEAQGAGAQAPKDSCKP